MSVVGMMNEDDHPGMFLGDFTMKLIDASILGDDWRFKAAEYINYGADINFKNADGKTPINIAATKGHLKLVKLLINRGADLTIVDKWKQTPLIAACRNSVDGADKKWFDIINNLVHARSPLNNYDIYGRTPLLICVDNGDNKITRLLVENGADIEGRAKQPFNPTPKYGSRSIDPQNDYTPLWFAVDNNNTIMLETLIKLKADVNATLKYIKQTPLMYSCWRELKDCTKLLINGGANINLQDRDGNSALMIACRGGHADFVNLLIKNEANINLQDHDGNSALMHYYLFGLSALTHSSINDTHKKQIDIARMLIDNGADFDFINKYGKSVWELLEESKADTKTEIEEMMKNQPEYMDKVSKNVREMTKKLIQGTKKRLDYRTSRSIAIDYMDPHRISKQYQEQKTKTNPHKSRTMMSSSTKGGRKTAKNKKKK
jgi:uncharacterized protein